MKTIPIAIRMATPIALSKDCKYPDRVLDRFYKQLPVTQTDLSSQCTLSDILRLIGDTSYTRQLPGGVDCPKERLWLAAFGISKGDRRAKSNRPGTPSGLLQIDVDHYSDNINALYEAQDKLMELPYIAATFISPSGTGIKALAAIEKVPEYDEARLLGIACTKAICDHMGLIGYREGTSKGADSTWARLPKELQERFGESHIDFSVATDPRKGCFIPAKDSNVLIKDESETLSVWTTRDTHKTLTGYYLDGQEHPFADQAPKTTTPAFYLPPSDMPSSAPASGDRWDRYVASAITDALSALENAGPGAHHQAAIAFGRTVAKFQDHIDTTDVFARADAIIDGWCPAASAPDVEKRTIREMDQYQDRIDKDAWLREHPSATPAKAPLTGEAVIIQKTTVDDIALETQPLISRGWGEEAVAELMVKSFLRKYRKTPDGGAVDIISGELLTRSQMGDMGDIVWFYVDSKGHEKKISLRQAFALKRDPVTATPVHRPDMRKGEMRAIKVTPDAAVRTMCVNISSGIPTLGYDLRSLTSSKAVQEAEIVADFIEGRFIDRERYPDEKVAKSHAQQEAAYYFKYIYQAMTDPTHRPPCAIAVLSEARGTGKSTVTMDIPRILGAGCCSKIEQQTIADKGALRFAWAAMAGAVFTVFDDFQDPRDSIAAHLRALISADTITVETKGVQGHSERNFSRILVSSNSKEFLRELNSGAETERRWHLFSFKNKMLEDRTCDAALSIIRYYLERAADDSILSAEDPELQAFRAALLLAFCRRVDLYEQTGCTVDLRQALETAEFRAQKDMGLMHNRVARVAGIALAAQTDHKMGKAELYDRIRMDLKDATLTDTQIRERLSQVPWLKDSRSASCRYWYLTPEGLKVFADHDEEEEDTETQLLTLQDKTPREKKAILQNLSKANKINILEDETGENCAVCILATGKVIEFYVGRDETSPVKYYQPTFYHDDYKGDSDDEF